jgi:hypothetical protein
MFRSIGARFVSPGLIRLLLVAPGKAIKTFGLSFSDLEDTGIMPCRFQDGLVVDNIITPDWDEVSENRVDMEASSADIGKYNEREYFHRQLYCSSIVFM